MQPAPSRAHFGVFSLLLSLALIFVVTVASAQSRPTGSDDAAAESADEKEGDAAPAPSLPQAWADAVSWRSIGPANMSGRIPALTVYEKDPSIWWAASASGGLLKTTNNGVTFTHQFDDQATVSIGDVKVAQSDPSVVWVGTGESNPRNSVSWGNGVYKSTDGGDTFTHMGLDETYQTGRIAIHPTNPDIVYVGALGRLWGPNEERGVFKTIDGGETWEKIFYLDDRTGIVELQMNPKDPDTLLAAAYERKRGRPRRRRSRGEVRRSDRDVQDDRWREELAPRHRGTPDGADGADRVRLFPQRSEHHLRGGRIGEDRQRAGECAVRGARRRERRRRGADYPSDRGGAGRDCRAGGGRHRRLR